MGRHQGHRSVAVGHESHHLPPWCLSVYICLVACFIAPSLSQACARFPAREHTCMHKWSCRGGRAAGALCKAAQACNCACSFDQPRSAPGLPASPVITRNKGGWSSGYIWATSLRRLSAWRRMTHSHLSQPCVMKHSAGLKLLWHRLHLTHAAPDTRATHDAHMCQATPRRRQIWRSGRG